MGNQASCQVNNADYYAEDLKVITVSEGLHCLCVSFKCLHSSLHTSCEKWSYRIVTFVKRSAKEPGSLNRNISYCRCWDEYRTRLFIVSSRLSHLCLLALRHPPSLFIYLPTNFRLVSGLLPSVFTVESNQEVDLSCIRCRLYVDHSGGLWLYYLLQVRKKYVSLCLSLFLLISTLFEVKYLSLKLVLFMQQCLM